MKYTIREGLVLESVCGVPLLIATLEARKHCPYLMQLNEASAYIWKMLFDGKTLAEMTALAANDFEITEEEAQQTLTAFLSDLEKHNYIILEK